VATGGALGLTLTLLFYHKYNYWLLVVLALLFAEVSSRPVACCRALIGALARWDWLAGLRAQLRHPLTYLLAVLLALLALVVGLGSRTIRIAGIPLSAGAAPNLLSVAYVVLFLRLLPWWYRSGRSWSARLGEPGRQLVYWHAWPVALGFLLPRRLGTFLWYLSPANGAVPQFSLEESARRYAGWLLADYHAHAGAAVLALALLSAAVLCRRSLRPGAAGVLWLFFIGAALTVAHPCGGHCRYLHSWIASGWVAAGAGLAAVCSRVCGDRPRWAALAGLGLLGVLGLLTLPSLLRPRPASVAGPNLRLPSILDVTDSYLSILDDSQRVAILPTVPFRFLAEWTFVERLGARVQLESHWFGFGEPGAANRRAFARWLETTTCDTLVFVNPLPGAEAALVCPSEPECMFLAELRPVMTTQTAFRPVRQQSFPTHGLSVAVWRRVSGKGEGAGRLEEGRLAGASGGR
jgi:hypothetical protein